MFVRHGTTNRGFNDGWIHATDQNLQFGGTDVDLRVTCSMKLVMAGNKGRFSANGKNYWQDLLP